MIDTTVMIPAKDKEGMWFVVALSEIQGIMIKFKEDGTDPDHIPSPDELGVQEGGLCLKDGSEIFLRADHVLDVRNAWEDYLDEVHNASLNVPGK